MARPLRIERPGGWFHCTARGNEQRPIYRDDRDRQHFCELLAEMVERFRIRLHVYVLMTNHYHLLLETPEPNLSRAMQWLNVSYSVWFNRRHQRSGHLFQGRFDAVVVDQDEWALSLSRYVHLNPVRLAALGMGKKDRQRQHAGVSEKPDAALVRKRIAILRAHRWSSYPAYIGAAKVPEWLECDTILAMGGARRAARRKAYQTYVEDAIREGLAVNPWAALKEQVILGGESFLNRLREYVRGNSREQTSLRRLESRPTFSQAIQAVEQVKGEPWNVFRDRHGDWGRDLVLYLGRKYCGMKLAELGKAAGGLDYVSVASAVRRLEQHLAHDKPLSRQLQSAMAQLKNK
jgi:putative transposase